MSIAAPNSVSDLIRAVHELRLHGGPLLEEVARALGLALAPAFELGDRDSHRVPGELSVPDAAPSTANSGKPGVPPSVHSPAQAHPEPSRPPTTEAFWPTRLTVDVQPELPVPPPKWNIAPPTQSLLNEDSDMPAQRMAHETLLSPLRSRALLAGTVSVRTDAGTPDIARLVDTMSRAESISRIPRSPCKTLRYGAQVLLDQRETMSLFARDQRDVLAKLRQVVGADRLQVLRFEGNPLHGVKPPGIRQSQPYEPPPPRTPVLLLTDLGLCSPSSGPLLGLRSADLDAWRQFAGVVHVAGCSLRALVPYPASLWPPELRPHMALFHWDRDLSVGQLQQTLARLSRRPAP